MSRNTGKRPDTATARASIEDNLRKVYQEALEEQIPDRFTQLLDKLRQAQPVQVQNGPARADSARKDNAS